MSHQPDNIFTGTQVVALVEIPGTNRAVVHTRGAVGVVTRPPAVEGEKFRVRFPDGFEASLEPDQLEVLKHFKDRLPRSAGDVAPSPGGEGRGEGEPSLQTHLQDGGVRGEGGPAFDLESCIIYRYVVGSRAYGLDTAKTSLVKA